MIDLNDFYLEGYVLLRADHPGWEQLKDGLLPDRLVSLSAHICPHLQIYWGWVPGNRDAAIRFGIPEERWDAFREWCKRPLTLDAMSAFETIESARDFIQQFLPDVENLYLIGAAYPKSLAEVDIEATHQEGKTTSLERRILLESGGEPLGFEVVSFAHNDFGCSWLCNYLHKDMHELFSIRPNGYGLIEREDDARKVSEWIAEDEMKGTRAEPEPYDYWLLVSYPLAR